MSSGEDDDEEEEEEAVAAAVDVEGSAGDVELRDRSGLDGVCEVSKNQFVS